MQTNTTTIDRNLLAQVSDDALRNIFCAALDQLEYERHSGDMETAQRAANHIRTINELIDAEPCPSSDWVYLCTSVVQRPEATAEIITEICKCFTAGMEVQRCIRGTSGDWETVTECPQEFSEFVYRVR